MPLVALALLLLALALALIGCASSSSLPLIPCAMLTLLAGLCTLTTAISVSLSPRLMLLPLPPSALLCDVDHSTPSPLPGWSTWLAVASACQELAASALLTWARAASLTHYRSVINTDARH
ncbi:uncharacterized protein LOC144955760 [Lampetra fluviatilis]